MPSFTDQRERLRRTVQNALDGCEYLASREEEGGRLLVIQARRGNGREISLRFRGVKSSEASVAPEAGRRILLRSVSSQGGGCLTGLTGLLVPRLRGPGQGYSRVRIEIGAATLAIDCQDAEWWEDDAAPTSRGESAT